MKWNGFWHSTLAKIAGGVFVVIILLTIAHCGAKGKKQVVYDDNNEAQTSNPEYDNLDVLGDYLFPDAPLQKDVTVEEDKSEKKDEKKSAPDGDEGGEILESADPTSAPAEEIVPVTPVEVPKTAAPKVEKIEQ